MMRRDLTRNYSAAIGHMAYRGPQKVTENIRKPNTSVSTAVWLDAACLLLPATPFMLATFDPWLPRQVWLYAVAAPLLGIASAIPVIGVAKIIGMFS